MAGGNIPGESKRLRTLQSSETLPGKGHCVRQLAVGQLILVKVLSGVPIAGMGHLASDNLLLASLLSQCSLSWRVAKTSICSPFSQDSIRQKGSELSLGWCWTLLYLFTERGMPKGDPDAKNTAWARGWLCPYASLRGCRLAPSTGGPTPRKENGMKTQTL